MNLHTPEHLDKKELLQIERQLRKNEQIHRKDVQNLLNQANLSRNPRIYASLINRLQLAIEEYQTEAMRRDDPFMPYCPTSLSDSGELYLLNQMDGAKISVSPETLVTGMLVIGPTGSGKTFFIVHLCEALLGVQR